MKKIISVSVTALVVVLIAAGIYSAMVIGSPVDAATATEGAIDEYLDERGKTRLPRVHLVSMPISGRIQHIDVTEGNQVAAGQVVAQLVAKDLDDAVAEAAASVARLDAAIRESSHVALEMSTYKQALEFVNSMKSTDGAAMARVGAGEKRVEFADSILRRVRTLVASQARTEEDLELAELQYHESVFNHRQDSLVWEAVKSIRAATEMLPQMVQDYLDRKTLTREVLENQKREAEARLSQIQTQRERGTMSSPVDGMVLERMVQNEQYLTAGTPLLRIGQLDLMEVETDVLSHEAVQVRPGNRVEIYGPAIGRSLGQGLTGNVSQVYPSGFTKTSSLGVEQQRVRVIVELPTQVIAELLEREVGVEYRVRVRIFTRSKASAVVIPRSALFRGPDQSWQVFVVRGTEADLRQVEVGLMNDEQVEITGGVAAGERVILAPESDLADGSRVADRG